MSRHTTFRYCLDPTVEQSVVLARHAGAARFAFKKGGVWNPSGFQACCKPP